MWDNPMQLLSLDWQLQPPVNFAVSFRRKICQNNVVGGNRMHDNSKADEKFNGIIPGVKMKKESLFPSSTSAPLFHFDKVGEKSLHLDHQCTMAKL